MKFSFTHHSCVIICIWNIAVMLQIILHHLVAYYSCASYSETYHPEVLAPVTLAKTREFLLKTMECSIFLFLYQRTSALILLHACEHGFCLLHLSKYEHPHCCISGLVIPGNVSEYRPATLHSDTLSPISCAMSNCLWYEDYDDSLSYHKFK